MKVVYSIWKTRRVLGEVWKQVSRRVGRGTASDRVWNGSPEYTNMRCAYISTGWVGGENIRTKNAIGTIT